MCVGGEATVTYSRPCRCHLWLSHAGITFGCHVQVSHVDVQCSGAYACRPASPVSAGQYVHCLCECLPAFLSQGTWLRLSSQWWTGQVCRNTHVHNHAAPHTWPPTQLHNHADTHTATPPTHTHGHTHAATQAHSHAATHTRPHTLTQARSHTHMATHTHSHKHADTHTVTHTQPHTRPHTCSHTHTYTTSMPVGLDLAWPASLPSAPILTLLNEAFLPHFTSHLYDARLYASPA